MITKKRTFGIRLTAAVLAAVFCLGIFAGCGKKEEAPAEKYMLCGAGISEYSIVIPENADICEEYAASLLAGKIREKTGRTVKILSDAEEETDCEILVGMTSRKAEKDAKIPESGCYSVYSVGTKAVLLGESYAVAGGIPTLIDSLDNGGKLPGNKDDSVKKYEPEPAENVILLIGDGMGKNHVLLAETESPKTVTTDGVTVPDEKSVSVFAANTFPNIGEMTTVNADGKTTDSAASATALATGHKTFNGALGMIPADLDSDGAEDELRSVQNAREAACLKGMKTAVLSTDRQTGATPNAFLVHHSDRHASTVILEQQRALEETQFSPEYLWCAYDSESFTEELRTAVGRVENEKGFFIMAEEAMIDKYASRLDFDNVIRTVKRMDDAIKLSATYAYCNPDTAVIVTADHETGGLTVGEDGEFMWTSDGAHTDTPVGVYALGEGTEIFRGTVDNTDIAKYIFNVVNK